MAAVDFYGFSEIKNFTVMVFILQSVFDNFI